MVLERTQKRAMVLFGTAFENREEPPKDEEQRKKYLCFAHRDNEAPGQKAPDLKLIRYEGSTLLKKDTFMKFTEPEYVDLEFTPLSYEGRLSTDSYAKLAEIMELPEGHQIRCQGAKELKQKEDRDKEREARKDAAKARKSGDDVVVDANNESFIPGAED